MKRCFYCHSIITSAYYKDRYGVCCCEKHVEFEKNVTFCTECMKLVPVSGNQLPDERVICKSCMAIAISPDRPYDWVLEQVVTRLNSAGFRDLKVADITIWTATSEEIAMFKKSDVNVFNGGFCSIQSNGKIKIYIQSHHTKPHFAGVLAHELLHAWCFQNRLFNVPKPIAEGFSNLGSYYMYESIDHPLAKVYIEQLFSDTDPDYGEGFRYMYEIYKKYGWDGVRNVVINSNTD